MQNYRSAKVFIGAISLYTVFFPLSASAVTFSFNSQIDTYIVPTTGVYNIDAIGAQGGNLGGFGGEISGDFDLTAGDVLSVLVGGAGGTSVLSGGGGGGGTFVVLNNTTPIPLVIAGGGGGNIFNVAFGMGVARQGGGGGGGFSTNAEPAGRGGNSFLNGGAPGSGGNISGFIGGNGGFGGGGGAGGGPQSGVGGGGGFTGGRGGSSIGFFDGGAPGLGGSVSNFISSCDPNLGAGGGSGGCGGYNSAFLDRASNLSYNRSVNTGNGSVNITFLGATSVPEPLTIVGTIMGGTAAFCLRKKLKKIAEIAQIH